MSERGDGRTGGREGTRQGFGQTGRPGARGSSPDGHIYVDLSDADLSADSPLGGWAEPAPPPPACPGSNDGVLPWRSTYVNFRLRHRVPPEDDDLALVQRAKAGEIEAFRSLVVRYQRKVYAVALGIVRDADMAWDVAQDAFVRAHRSLDGFKGESSFFTWLFRIATRVSIDSLRKERPWQRDEVDLVREADFSEGGEGILATALGTDPRETLLRRELADKMEAALATLSEKHRTILVLREVEGLSYEELADRLGIHKGTVMSRLFHARRKMQAALRSYAGITSPDSSGGIKVEGDVADEE